MFATDFFPLSKLTSLMRKFYILLTQCIHALYFLASKEARKYSAAQGPHSEVVPRAFWKFMSKSCDECKGLFARGCEAKRWSHWTCSSLGTIFQPMRINSVPDVKCFCNHKNVLRAQSMIWHFVHHPVYYIFIRIIYIVWNWYWVRKRCIILKETLFLGIF